MANDGARELAPLRCQPGQTQTHGHCSRNCQNTSDLESRDCTQTPKLGTPSDDETSLSSFGTEWRRSAQSQDCQTLRLARVISVRNGALSLGFALPSGSRSPPGKGTGTGQCPIPGATALHTPSHHSKPGSLLAENHPTAGFPLAEPAALISSKCRASSSRACSSHRLWSRVFLQGKS